MTPSRIFFHFNILIFIYFSKYETIEIHARTFLPLNISAVGSVKMLHIWGVLFCSFHVKILWEEHMSAELLRKSERFGNWCFLAHFFKPYFPEVNCFFWLVICWFLLPFWYVEIVKLCETAKVVKIQLVEFSIFLYI